MLVGKDKSVEDGEHYFPQEKELKQPTPSYNCWQHFNYDEFIKRYLEY